MIYLALLATVMAGDVNPLTQVAPVEHRGVAYNVTYEPKVSLTAKTIGTAAGTRPFLQRCLWSATVSVERKVHRPGEPVALDKVLPETRTLSGSLDGNCQMHRKTLSAEKIAQRSAVREHMDQVVEADQRIVLADIDSARALN
ncbi:hypothetical protein ACFB49_01150 [Sphingomonas sp. DBB INV C78]|uniref:hypothetical protein n=1 Tax=Sphingomonas sp. DBB INV C78 TaxID=3349434 RepID=UPI0036D3A7B1